MTNFKNTNTRTYSHDNSVIPGCDITLIDVFKAYYDCRKHKRNTVNALDFEINLEKNIIRLYTDLVSGNYTISTSICFVVEHPKIREVWAANFRDRIVHHLIYNRYAQLFYNSFIHDSYACIPKKGTLAAAERVHHFCRATIQESTDTAYYLKADIANFFMSIVKNILENLLRKKITNDWWFALTKQILHHDPRQKVILKSSSRLMRKVPRHKSLFYTPLHAGLPIGNLSSQLFANIYLNELDQYVKHELKVKRYARYVDDIVILDRDPSKLHLIYQKISNFVNQFLNIRFHPDKTIVEPISKNGVQFVGYLIKQYNFCLLNHIIKNCYTRIEETSNLIPTVNSYFGMLVNTDSYRKRKQLSNHIVKNYECLFDSELTKILTPKLT